MPHIVIEHSNTIDGKRLMEIADTLLARSSDVKKVSIKSRAIGFDQYLIGGRSDREFVAVTVRLMQGRSESVRSEMAKSIFEGLSKELDLKRTALSVDIVEINNSIYVTQNPD